MVILEIRIRTRAGLEELEIERINKIRRLKLCPYFLMKIRQTINTFKIR